MTSGVEGGSKGRETWDDHWETDKRYGYFSTMVLCGDGFLHKCGDFSSTLLVTSCPRP